MSKAKRVGEAAPHPMQPLFRDESGVIRFRKNKIVAFLLDANGKFNMNELALVGFDADEWTQFAQLIGYSVDGWGTLSYVSNKDYAKAQRKRNEFERLSAAKRRKGARA